MDLVFEPFFTAEGVDNGDGFPSVPDYLDDQAGVKNL